MLRFAFRNVLRNRKRSALTASAILLASIVVCISQGWMNGMLDMFQENFVRYQTGSVRITTESYLKRERFMPVDETIASPAPLIENIRKIRNVTSVEEKIRFGMLLGHGEVSAPAFGMGLDLVSNTFGLSRRLVEGQIGTSGIYIGINLAKKLGVRVGEKLLIATQASDGSLNGITAQVNGIFRFGVTTFDGKYFFLSLPEARKLLRLGNSGTEIYIYTRRPGDADAAAAEIRKLLPEGLKAETFKEQMRLIYDMLMMSRRVFLLVEAFIVFLASFVVINTLMMAIFERTREIGTLKAMGMTDRAIFFNFILEGAILGGFGGVLGGMIGYGFNALFNRTGINLEFMLKDINFPMEYIVRPNIGLDTLILTVVLAVIVPALATIFPARRAWRMVPAEALRK